MQFVFDNPGLFLSLGVLCFWLILILPRRIESIRDNDHLPLGKFLYKLSLTIVGILLLIMFLDHSLENGFFNPISITYYILIVLYLSGKVYVNHKTKNEWQVKFARNRLYFINAGVLDVMDEISIKEPKIDFIQSVSHAPLVVVFRYTNKQELAELRDMVRQESRLFEDLSLSKFRLYYKVFLSLYIISVAYLGILAYFIIPLIFAQ